MNPDLLRACWFLAGPTASGKTAVGIELARLINAEILALDSMTVYRELDIGTAKPTAAEQAESPHHLLDLIDPSEEFSIALYLQAAESAVRDVLNRGKTPLFVGGSGLYLRSLLRGVFDGPAADPAIREQWQRFANERGIEALHQRLMEVDPPTAARLHIHDVRRVIRALEVYELTGVALSAQQQQPVRSREEQPLMTVWLAPPRAWLCERIDRRVELMFTAGWIEEADRLRQREQGLGPTARHALGYDELIDWLNQQRKPDFANVVNSIQTRTRQFSKRQQTWFRNLAECTPVTMTGGESPRELAETILRMPRGSA